MEGRVKKSSMKNDLSNEIENKFCVGVYIFMSNSRSENFLQFIFAQTNSQFNLSQTISFFIFISFYSSIAPRTSKNVLTFSTFPFILSCKH